MATRTRQAYLKDLTLNHSTNTTIEPVQKFCKLILFLRLNQTLLAFCFLILFPSPLKKLFLLSFSRTINVQYTIVL